MKYLIKFRGEFEETQEVEAASREEAETMVRENLGMTIERTAISNLELLDVIEAE